MKTRNITLTAMSHSQAMALVRKESEKNRKEPLFAAGDRVTFTNDQGCVFTGKTVVRHELIDGRHRYYITPTSTPWYPAHESNLSAV